MGNQLDRITHLNYSELPTGDPSGIEKDELRVGVAYFFSDEEEDLDERGQPDKFGVKGPPGCSPCPESPSRHHRVLKSEVFPQPAPLLCFCLQGRFVFYLLL